MLNIPVTSTIGALRYQCLVRHFWLGEPLNSHRDRREGKASVTAQMS